MALVERQPSQVPAVEPARAVTPDELDLVKKTIAAGATADELKLYLYDCARQGVHPLDRLLHFTKRAGKYTPITSIDFMRIRAADTGEYVGSDDAVFVGAGMKDELFAATVTVWRFVQGVRCPFTATARWTEYKPDQNDFMWKKMPHTMLGKCAEALALRKGFPRQLAGLYAGEEMEQAGNSKGPVLVTVDEAPVTRPAGFDAWWADMVAVADEGYAALEKAFKASKVEFRKYITEHGKAEIDALKTKARAVTP